MVKRLQYYRVHFDSVDQISIPSATLVYTFVFLLLRVEALTMSAHDFFAGYLRKIAGGMTPSTFLRFLPLGLGVIV